MQLVEWKTKQPLGCWAAQADRLRFPNLHLPAVFVNTVGNDWASEAPMLAWSCLSGLVAFEVVVVVGFGSCQTLAVVNAK